MSADDRGWRRGTQAPDRRSILLGGTTLAAAAVAGTAGPAMQVAEAQPQPAPSSRKPNILFIMGDDIGWFNVSAYNMGIMGYRTPNIDRIGREGAIFTDWYGQQSCTAGRAAFITGQTPVRTGLTKVGLPGAEYANWHSHRAFLLVPAQAAVAKYVESFKEFPPRAKAASFTVSDVMDKLTTATANKN